MIPLAFAACPHCGAAQETGSASPGRKLDESQGELHEIDREQARRQFQQDRAGAKSLDELIALGRAKGYKNPEAWAGHFNTHGCKSGTRPAKAAG